MKLTSCQRHVSISQTFRGVGKWSGAINSLAGSLIGDVFGRIMQVMCCSLIDLRNWRFRKGIGGGVMRSINWGGWSGAAWTCSLIALFVVR